MRCPRCCPDRRALTLIELTSGVNDALVVCRTICFIRRQPCHHRRQVATSATQKPASGKCTNALGGVLGLPTMSQISLLSRPNARELSTFSPKPAPAPPRAGPDLFEAGDQCGRP